MRDLDHPDSHYDYRGAFLAGLGRGASTGHFPDTFKQHGHPTFSVESKYSAGPGDGGSWRGDTFVPSRPMTDAGPRMPLPGESPLTRPYGMSGGPVRLAGINDQPGQRFASPAPENVDLDSPEANAPFAAKPVPEPVHTGWEVTDPAGRPVMNLPLRPEASQAYQAFQITKAGKALLDNAVTPEEQEAAKRAIAWGLSRAGSAPSDEVTKELVHRYDTDMGNSTKVQIQGMKKRVPGGGGMGGGVGPTKADKYSHTVDKDLMSQTNAIIKDQQGAGKYAAISSLDNDVSEMERLISAPGAMGQRVAVQKALLALTGKASRESEQAALAGAAGKWEELKNKLSLWTTDDPTLSQAYIEEFRNMLGTQRQYIEAQKERMGQETAARVAASAAGYPPEDIARVHDIAYGAMTGKYQGAAEYNPKPATPAPKKGAVDEDLLK